MAKLDRLHSARRKSGRRRSGGRAIACFPDAEQLMGAELELQGVSRGAHTQSDLETSDKKGTNDD